MRASATARSRALCTTVSTIALAVGLATAPHPARAADKSREPGRSGVTIGEVVVTAQKREENLQTVPVAVTAITSDVRDKAGIISAQDEMNFTPGVTYDPQNDHLDIRGIGKVTTYIGTDPGVAVYTDGFYVGSAVNLNTTTLETDRVEVLRGPQGTLYGRNSIGGAVNQISRRPDNEFTGEVRGSVNNWSGGTWEARISGPVNDWLKLSAYVEGNDQNGTYMHRVAPHTAPAAPAMPGNDTSPATPAYPAATCQSLNFASVVPMTCSSFNNPGPGTGGAGDGWIANFQASYNFGPSFDGWFSARFAHQFSRPGQAGITTPWDPIPLTVPSVFYGFQGIQQPGLYDPRAIAQNWPTTDHLNSKKFVTQDTWHASGFDVRFVGGYWDYTERYNEDGDAVPDPPTGVYEPTYAALNGAAPYPFPTSNPKDPLSTVIDPNQLTYGFSSEFSAWSTEINFISTTKGPLQWLAGVYYYNEHNDQEVSYQTVDSPVYNYVTDYLFNGQGCLPFAAGGFANISTGSGCAFGVPVSVLGYNPAYGGGPSTIPNYPGGPLNQQMNMLGRNGQASPNSNCLYCTDAYLRTQSEAVFGQVDWRPNDKLHLTAGFRYSWDQKQGYEQEIDVYWIPLVATAAQAQQFGFPTYPANWPVASQRGQYVMDYVGTSCSSPGLYGIQPYSSTAPCPAHRSVRHQWQAPTGTAAVEWTPNPDTNLYVRYGRGYKSGGFNLGALVAGSGQVDSEYLDDFEGGWKQNIGHALQFDVAAFYYSYHGLQANNATVQNSSPPIVINELVNIEKSHAYGVEFESKWIPVRNLLVLFNYSYLHAINDTDCTFSGSGPTLVETNCFIDSANPLGASVVNGQTLTGVHPVGPQIAGNQPQSLKGNVLPYSPEHKISASLSYTFKFGIGDLTLSALENYHTSFYDNLFSTQEWKVRGGETTDFRVTWVGHDGRYQIIGTVSNAFDNLVETAYSTLPPSNAYYAYNSLENPRIWTLEVRYHF